MRFIAAGIGLALTVFPGGARAFVPPQTLVGGGAHRISTTGGSGDSHASLSSVAAVAEATRWRSAPATASGKTAASGIIAAVDVGSATRVKTSLHARGGSDEDAEGGLSKTAAMSGVGSTGSNALLLVATVLVLKGLFLPEEIRHLSFCPTEDPIRGRDTLPWRMMIESGRECGTVPEVMFKYVTSPVAIPGTPEWGTMLNVKEDLAKDAWMEEANK